MSRIHGYDNAENSIETACGRLAYDLTGRGDLKEPPLLLISGDWFMVTCLRCIKIWNIPPSYSMFRQIFNGPDLLDKQQDTE